MNIDKLHDRFIRWQSQKAAKRLLRQLNAESIVLELGSGSGHLAKKLKDYVCRFIESDQSPQRDGVNAIDAHTIPLPDDSVDWILCSNTLEHLHTPSKALQEMYRVGNNLWLTWTPWWSPFGCHSIVPWHYFGINNCGAHKLNSNLFRTIVAETLLQLDQAGWKVVDIYPRYWPSLKFLVRWKWTREWATWNLEVVATRN